MPRSSKDEEPDGDDLPADRPTKRAARHRGRPHRRTRPAKEAPAGLEPWAGPTGSAVVGADPEHAEAGTDRPTGWFHRRRERVYFRARDAWWFDLVVTLAVVIVIIVGLYAYTGNWPPIYVVESESMQHGYDDQLGLINTGDLVLAQHVPIANIQTYVVGMQHGYSTYGEYGDVLLYHAYGSSDGAPIIHRAILYLDYNQGNDSFNAPSLNGLPCGPGSDPAAFYTANGPNSRGGCGTIGLSGTLTLHGVGWQSTNVVIPMDSATLGRHSGFITMGDNNFQNGYTQGVPDQTGGISEIVDPGWILGVARGMIPWFGAIKLYFGGNASEVPSASWEYLGLTTVAIFLAALSIHLFLRSRGIEDERRRADEEEGAHEPSGPPEQRRRSGWFGRGPPPTLSEEEPEPGDDPPRANHRRGPVRRYDPDGDTAPPGRDEPVGGVPEDER